LNIREKIQQRLDELQRMVETHSHLDNPDFVTEKILSVTKFWSILSEEEREFVSALWVLIRSIESQENSSNPS